MRVLNRSRQNDHLRMMSPVHPVRVAVLPLGSSIEIAFEGGPRKWPLLKESHFTILEASQPELIDIQLIRDPIRYNRMEEVCVKEFLKIFLKATHSSWDPVPRTVSWNKQLIYSENCITLTFDDIKILFFLYKNFNFFLLYLLPFSFFSFAEDLTVFRVLCKALGENVLTFRIGNEPSATNKHPAKQESSIKFECSKPLSLHLKLHRNSKEKKLKDESIVKVPFYGTKLFSVDVWLKDFKGRKLYNISTLILHWKVSDFSLAQAEDTEKGFMTHDAALNGYRKISREFKEFKMTGGAGRLKVTAELEGYKQDVLKKAGISIVENLNKISGSIDLNLVSLRDINAGLYSMQDSENQVILVPSFLNIL
ncbi:UNVERIFIED_CONTAM: Nuclear pore membrane glycoprotein [Trichonephila clavipes]